MRNANGTAFPQRPIREYCRPGPEGHPALALRTGLSGGTAPSHTAIVEGRLAPSAPMSPKSSSLSHSTSRTSSTSPGSSPGSSTGPGPEARRSSSGRGPWSSPALDRSIRRCQPRTSSCASSKRSVAGYGPDQRPRPARHRPRHHGVPTPAADRRPRETGRAGRRSTLFRHFFRGDIRV